MTSHSNTEYKNPSRNIKDISTKEVIQIHCSHRVNATQSLSQSEPQKFIRVTYTQRVRNRVGSHVTQRMWSFELNWNVNLWAQKNKYLWNLFRREYCGLDWKCSWQCIFHLRLNSGIRDMTLGYLDFIEILQKTLYKKAKNLRPFWRLNRPWNPLDLLHVRSKEKL